jgi:hypothetical protein
LRTRYLQIDEIWTYVGKKRRNVRKFHLEHGAIIIVGKLGQHQLSKFCHVFSLRHSAGQGIVKSDRYSFCKKEVE